MTKYKNIINFLNIQKKVFLMAESVNSALADDKSANKMKNLSLKIDEYLKKMNEIDDSKAVRLLKLTE